MGQTIKLGELRRIDAKAFRIDGRALIPFELSATPDETWAKAFNQTTKSREVSAELNERHPILWLRSQVGADLVPVFEALALAVKDANALVAQWEYEQQEAEYKLDVQLSALSAHLYDRENG